MLSLDSRHDYNPQLMCQFDGVPPSGPDNDDSGKDSKKNIPLERHVFQTIFLNNDPESQKYWSKNEIDGEKV